MTVSSAFLSFEKNFDKYSAFCNIVDQHALCVSDFLCLFVLMCLPNLQTYMFIRNKLFNKKSTTSLKKITKISTVCEVSNKKPTSKKCLLESNFQFCTHGIVIYIFSIYQKSKFFSLLKKFSLSSLQLIYFYVHLPYLFFGTFANAI